jgi:hypothetical protein
MIEQPLIEKSKLGDLWKITHGDSVVITNQKGVERFLEKLNERQKQSEGMS